MKFECENIGVERNILTVKVLGGMDLSIEFSGSFPKVVRFGSSEYDAVDDDLDCLYVRTSLTNNVFLSITQIIRAAEGEILGILEEQSEEDESDDDLRRHVRWLVR